MYRDHVIGVVVPAHNEARLLPETLRSMPAFVDHVVVVDDASTDHTLRVARDWDDARVEVVAHAVNRGVGAAIVSGYRRAAELGCDLIGVMAGDAQMDPGDLPGLLDAAVDEGASYVKGDRLAYPGVSRAMPPVRLAGTWLLALLTRWPSGFAELRDSQCGYTVIRRDVLERLPLAALYPRYGFPNDLLVRVGEAGGSLAQRPVRPVYGAEVSGLRVPRVVLPICGILLRGAARRVAGGARRRLFVGTAGHGPARAGLSLWALAALSVGFLAGVLVRPGLADESAPAEENDAAVQLAAQVVDLVEREYYEPVDIDQVVYHGLHGMVGTLDSNSRFLPPREYAVWQSRIHGKQVGIGVDLRLNGDGFVVASITPNSPAERAGIGLDALLLAIDDEPLAGLGLDDVRERMNGDVGTKVMVRWRSATGEVKELELTREKVRAVGVVCELLPSGLAHVRVASFQDGAADDIVVGLERLTQTYGGPLRGVVLDVRDNLGGLLDEALRMADLFLPAGKVIVTLERRGEVAQVHETSRPLRIDLPLVVVVNQRSASASELLAAALSDHGRAMVVGWPTYGKGSVQSTYGLNDGSGLKITTSHYFTPLHRAIDGRGVVPDIEVADKPGTTADDALLVATEVLLGESSVMKDWSSAPGSETPATTRPAPGPIPR